MKKIRLSTVSQVYEAFLHSRKALGAKEVTLRTYRTSFLAVCKYADNGLCWSTYSLSGP